MSTWRFQLKHDPIAPILSSGKEAVIYSARRDLMDEDVGSIDRLWQEPEAQKILKKQLPDGSWPRSGENKHPAINYHLIETWRWFRYLIELYGFSHQQPQARQAAEYFFSCQTNEGDFRGILANQYATYYSGAILALLVQAGYEQDPRVEKCFQWLLRIRQSDQGWSVPMITHKLDRETQYRLSSEYAEPLEPDLTKPFSHNATGMILRAFAVHSVYRNSEAAITAGNLLKSRFFREDAYTSYQSADYWVRFEYPFWWNNLLSAMDSLSRMGFSKDDPQIKLALDWFRNHQEEGGLWKVSYMEQKKQEKDSPKIWEMKLWISLAICRIFKRLYG
ncbi:MAG: hypothetical protein A2Y88_05600 [Chloroflexi bacterium RBG_13_48_10]|nr:MAG: hypothetical protein A2Y88_05600 [Chloroflexi bacterium RBG_13_48_10]